MNAALELAGDLCDPPYARADAAAMQQQRRHRALVRIIAIAGTAGIVAGIAPLAAQMGGDAATILQAASAITALVAVGLGIYLRSERQWLLERHRAERLRMAQYRVLIAFAARTIPDHAQLERELAAAVEHIGDLTAADMRAWLLDDEPRRFEHRDGTHGDDARTLATLYADGRLREQCEYFRARARHNERAGQVTQHLSSALFFVSVFAIVPASLIRILRGPEAVADMFVWIAAGLPALAAGIRVFRSAHEFTRNGTRFRAKYIALSGLRDRLAGASDAVQTVADLQHAELLLEAEHREWLRLMRSAEWY